MKKIIALAAVAIAAQAVATFAGEPVVSSKQVIAPPPPPVSFFRGNEFDIGAFATYVTGTNGGGTRQTVFDDGTTFTLSSSRSPHGWGGGMDFTYFFPWKYAGVRFQGAGVAVTSGNVTVTDSNGFSRSGSGNGAAGVITGDFILRLPLDDFWPSVHLAPYIFGGGGGLFTGAGGNTINTRFPGAKGSIISLRTYLTIAGLRTPAVDSSIGLLPISESLARPVTTGSGVGIITSIRL
jgi:hypothetical protein